MSQASGFARVSWRAFNIGNNAPVELLRHVAAQKNFMPMQPGVVLAAEADVSELEKATGFRARTSIEDGVARFAARYQGYFGW